MKATNSIKPVVAAVGVVLVAGMTSVSASANPFSANALDAGYAQTQLADAEGTMKKRMPVEGKCGEGKCGGEAKATEGKCGEGKCGGEAKATEGKCGEGKCGGEEKAMEGKCGEGKCGGDKKIIMPTKA